MKLGIEKDGGIPKIMWYKQSQHDSLSIIFGIKGDLSEYYLNIDSSLFSYKQRGALQTKDLCIFVGKFVQNLPIL